MIETKTASANAPAIIAGTTSDDAQCALGAFLWESLARLAVRIEAVIAHDGGAAGVSAQIKNDRA